MISITTANVTVMVRNMDIAIFFYKNIGLELKQRWDNHYAQVAAPGVVIGLHPANEVKSDGGNISIGFGVDDLDPVKKRLGEMGVRFSVSSDKSGDILSFSDPDGTPLYFMQSKIGSW